MSDPPVDPTLFRQQIARWVTGVAIVTAREGSADVGLTVNSLTSIALDPPLLLVSLSEQADTTPVVGRVGTFGVSLLTVHQRALSERFARTLPPAAKFEGVALHRGATGSALLDGALATFDCRVEASHPHGDHRLVIGRVIASETGSDALPLVFFRSRYAPPEAIPGLGPRASSGP
ncbi:MAG: flavin reductase family protein [Thermoplasmata archaeon]|nr:flavin reductase family protein [Thermoplasmata archaeon]